MKRSFYIFISLFLLLTIVPSSAVAAGSTQIYKFVKVSSFKSHTLALREDGTVWAWGYDNAHQTGQTSFGPVINPVYVEGIDNVVDIAAGSGHSVAVKADGTVWAWGNNLSGELGVETTDAQTVVPVKVEGLENVKAVTAGSSYTMALKEDGTVWAFGANSCGNLGDGTTTYRRTPVKIDIEGVKSISASHYYSSAVKGDGTLWVWGTRSRIGYAADRLKPVQVYGVIGVKKVSLGLFQGTILKEDGTVWQWVFNVSLANSNDPDETIVLRQINGLAEVKDIEAGDRHTIALKKDGSIRSWGQNKSGELGIGTNIDMPYPVKIEKIDNITGISAGEGYSTAIKSDGTIWSWGRNDLGQLGNGSVSFVSRPDKLSDLNNITNIVTGPESNHVIVQKDDGSIWVWGSMGNIKYTKPQMIKIKGNVKKIAVGFNFTVMLLEDGSVWGWGDNSANQLAYGKSSYLNVPVRLNLPGNVMDIYAGSKNVFAVKDDGTVITAGQNTPVEPGIGNQKGQNQIEAAGLSDIKKIESVNRYNVALRNDGNVLTWGLDMNLVKYGEEPKLLEKITGVKDIETGKDYTLLFKDDGSLWKLMSKKDISSKRWSITLEKVDGIDQIFSIAKGGYFSLALKEDGAVWSWGHSSNGQLGYEEKTNIEIPRQINDLANIKAIAAGQNFALALQDDGTVWAWGNNDYGILTDNKSNKNFNTPVKVNIHNTIYLTEDRDEGTFADSEINGDTENVLYPAYVQENGVKKWGLIDKNGRFVVEPVYNTINDFWGNGLAKVAVSVAEEGYIRNYFGLINKKGEIVVQPTYSNIIEPIEDIMIIRESDSNNRVIDEKGSMLFETKYYISNFRDGMARFYDRGQNNEYIYGYLNSRGEVVIPPQYKKAEDFKNGKALVTTRDNKKLVIDKEGQTLHEIDFDNPVNLSEDIFTFVERQTEQNRTLEKKGYASLDGTIVAEAKFVSAEPFKGGFAVVATDYTYPNSGGHVGLIDKNGDFVIPPENSDIKPVGEGYFAVGRGGFSFVASNFSKKALYNSAGKQLTDFLFYTIGDLIDGHFPVCDGERVFFIDTNGKEADDYPKAQSIGVFKDMGEVVQGKFDNEIVYYSKDGSIAYKPQETWKYKTSQGIEIYEKKYKPDFDTTIYYPEIRNHPDSNMQDTLNSALKNIFVDKNKEAHGKDLRSINSFSVNFTASQNKDLLLVCYSSYLYPYGAAHGMPAREYYLFNINNGNTYKLSDLFRRDSAYLDRLSNIIKEKIQQKKADINSMILINGFEGFKKDPKFTVTKDALQIYFYPYEIAAYAAGFPTFDIPYTELADILDFEGEFWNSFEKNYQIAPQPTADKKVKAEAAVSELMNSYEKYMIEAINNKDFSYVKPYLLPVSSLYQSQKGLVDYLGSLEIREKLEEYRLHIIEWKEEISLCRIYVYEKTTIKYSENVQETKDFYWIYTAQYNTEEQKYQLRDIEIWYRE